MATKITIEIPEGSALDAAEFVAACADENVTHIRLTAGTKEVEYKLESIQIKHTPQGE